MDLHLTGRSIRNNCMSAGRSAMIIFCWPAGTRWAQYTSADPSAMNLHLTGQSVQEGYNNCMLAGRFSMIILHRPAGTRQ